MNRIWIAVLLLTFFTKNSYSQKLDFMDTSNKWRVRAFFVPPGQNPKTETRYFSYGYLNYTVNMGGYEYQVLTSNFPDTIFVRKDSISGKIYAVTPALPQRDSTDRLLYDFSMNKGDSYIHYIRYYGYGIYGDYDTVTYRVLETDSVIIDGLSHRIQYISTISSISKDRHIITVIEGVGSITGMGSPLYFGHLLYARETTDCFHSNNGNPVFAHKVLTKYFYNDSSSNSYALDTFDNSCPPKLAISQTKSDDNRVTIYPQPAKNHVVIDLGTMIADGRITIINIQGQVIIDRTIVNEQKFNLKFDLPTGMYIYKIVDHLQGVQFTGKILIE